MLKSLCTFSLLSSDSDSQWREVNINVTNHCFFCFIYVIFVIICVNFPIFLQLSTKHPHSHRVRESGRFQRSHGVSPGTAGRTQRTLRFPRHGAISCQVFHFCHFHVSRANDGVLTLFVCLALLHFFLFGLV